MEPVEEVHSLPDDHGVDKHGIYNPSAAGRFFNASSYFFLTGCRITVFSFSGAVFRASLR